MVISIWALFVSSKSCVLAQRAGIGPVDCRRGGLRSALDIAMDSTPSGHSELVEWLRAQGGVTAGEGSMRDQRLKSWQERGWIGDHIANRDPEGNSTRTLANWDQHGSKEPPTTSGYLGNHPPAAATSQSSPAEPGGQSWSDDARWSQNWGAAAPSGSGATSSTAPWRQGQWGEQYEQHGKWHRPEAKSSGKGSK